MKKGDIVTATVEKVEFPNKGILRMADDDKPIVVKGGIPGEVVNVRITKKRTDKYEGIINEVLQKAANEIEPQCPHAGECGGCSYQSLGYEAQLSLKKSQMIDLFRPVVTKELIKNKNLVNMEENDIPGYFDEIFEGVEGSPVYEEYRNKMEFSFGDMEKGGKLELGLHRKGSFYDVVTVNKCRIVDSDYRLILDATIGYFRGLNCTYYHKITHEGFLRHLLVRKSVKTGEIMVCLVTSDQIPDITPCCEKGIIEDWLEMLKNLEFRGTLTSVIHIVNDSFADAVRSDETRILYGRDYIEEELLGLKFKITPFSFFQTNSLSAEVIYSVARDFLKVIGESTGTLFDLYSGTGTIAQLMAPVVKKVIGVEIVAEAVEAARENAKQNGVNNCEFIADDVLKALDEISDKPDCIILDPPRDGVNPKALRKIIDYGVPYILYISCKPTSLARDFEMLIGSGYVPVRMKCVDQFPATANIETICLLSKKNAKNFVEIGVDAEDYYRIKEK